MADLLNDVPQPPRQAIPAHRIFASIMAAGLLVFIILGFFGVVGNATPDSRGWGFYIMLPVISLLVALFLAAQIFLLLNPPSKRARRMLDTFRRIYSAEPDWQTVDLRHVPRTNTAFLSRIQGQFEAEGLHHLGDFENAGLRRALPDARIGTRIMIEPGGTSFAAFFVGSYRPYIRLLKLLLRKRGSYRSCTQQTYLSDGRILVTHFPDGNPGRSLPWCVSFEVPWEAGVAALVHRHRTELAAYLASHPGVEVLHCPTPELLTTRLNEESWRVRKLFEETGYLTPDDLRRMYGPESATARTLIPALEHLLHEDSKKARALQSAPADVPAP